METQNFFCIEGIYQGNTKKLMEFFKKFNTLIKINPNEAEKIATDILNRINFNDKNEDEIIKNENRKLLLKK